MPDVTPIQSPIGPQEPSNRKEKKEGSPEKFQEEMKIQRVSETDPEQQKKRKRREEDVEEDVESAPTTPQAPSTSTAPSLYDISTTPRRRSQIPMGNAPSDPIPYAKTTFFSLSTPDTTSLQSDDDSFTQSLPPAPTDYSEQAPPPEFADSSSELPFLPSPIESQESPPLPEYPPASQQLSQEPTEESPPPSPSSAPQPSQEPSSSQKDQQESSHKQKQETAKTPSTREIPSPPLEKPAEKKAVHPQPQPSLPIKEPKAEKPAPQPTHLPEEHQPPQSFLPTPLPQETTPLESSPPPKAPTETLSTPSTEKAPSPSLTPQHVAAQQAPAPSDSLKKQHTEKEHPQPSDKTAPGRAVPPHEPIHEAPVAPSPETADKTTQTTPSTTTLSGLPLPSEKEIPSTAQAEKTPEVTSPPEPIEPATAPPLPELPLAPQGPIKKQEKIEPVRRQAKEHEAVEEAELAGSVLPALPEEPSIPLQPEKHKKEQDKEAVLSPTSSLAPAASTEETPLAPPPTAPMFTRLHPQILDLFERIVGTITILQLQGKTETTIQLTSPQFASSVFFGSEIVIQEFSSAQKAYNIQFIGPPQAVKIFDENAQQLLNSFQAGGYPFTIQRIESRLQYEEKHLIRRKESAADEDNQHGDASK